MWSVLEPANRAKLGLVVRDIEDSKAPGVLKTALKIAELDSYSVPRMQSLGAPEFAKLIDLEPHTKVIDEAVRRYCTSTNFTAANSRYNAFIQPILSLIQPHHVRRILRARKDEHADLYGAHSFYTFAQHVFDTQPIQQSELISILHDQEMPAVINRLRPETPTDAE